MSTFVALESLVNQILKLDPFSQQAFGRFAGKVIAIEIEGSSSTCFVHWDLNGIRLTSEYVGVPDLSIQGSFYSILKLLVGSSTSIQSSSLTLKGSLELAQLLKIFRQEFEIDWEEKLSGWLGDIPAHYLGQWIRSVGKWQRSRVIAFKQNCVDFLQEEIRILPPKIELEYFYEEVDHLRRQVEQLEAKIYQFRKRKPINETADSNFSVVLD